MQLNGKWATGSIEITLHNFSGTGTYAIGQFQRMTVFINGEMYAAGYDYLTSTTYGSGAVVFTEVSKDLVKGSFNYTVIKDFGQIQTISNGEFLLERTW